MANASHEDVQSTGNSETEGGGARERHLLGAYSVNGLDRLTLSYDAPWPFNTILSDEYLAIMSLVTRRILAIAQLTSLSRHVWGCLRSCRLRSRQTKGKPQQRGNNSYERLIYASFCLIRQAFQAVSSFTSDRLRLQHDNFKIHLSTPSVEDSLRDQGFGKFAETIRSYIR